MMVASPEIIQETNIPQGYDQNVTEEGILRHITNFCAYDESQKMIRMEEILRIGARIIGDLLPKDISRKISYTKSMNLTPHLVLDFDEDITEEVPTIRISFN